MTDGTFPLTPNLTSRRDFLCAASAGVLTLAGCSGGAAIAPHAASTMSLQELLRLNGLVSVTYGGKTYDAAGNVSRESQGSCINGYAIGGSVRTACDPSAGFVPFSMITQIGSTQAINGPSTNTFYSMIFSDFMGIGPCYGATYTVAGPINLSKCGEKLAGASSAAAGSRNTSWRTRINILRPSPTLHSKRSASTVVPAGEWRLPWSSS